MAKSVQKTCTPLLTFEEYESEIKKIENTRLGSTIPIIKVEYSRVFLAVVGFFLVGFIYSFVRQFKDMIIYDAFNDASLSVWFELLSFLCSFKLIKVVTSNYKINGVEKGTDLFILGTILLYCCSGILIVINRFILVPDGLCELFFNGKILNIRGFSIFKSPIKLIINFCMSFFYVGLEVTSSYLISYVYMAYISSKTTYGQMKRYIFLILIGANLSLYISAEVIEWLCYKINYNAVCNTKWKYYLMSLTILLFLMLILLLIKKLMDIEFNKPLYINASNESNVDMTKNNNNQELDFIFTIKTSLHVKWLLGIVTMAIFYNFCNSILSLYSYFVYSDHATFLIQNPEFIKIPGFIPTSSSIGFIYKTLECKLTSVLSIIFMMLPGFKKLFDEIGIFGFNLIVVICSVGPILIGFIFSAINYPYSYFGKKIFPGIIIPSKDQMFELESIFCMFGNMVNKVSKYAFYDIIKENVTAKINPNNKIVYKGIFDGLAPKAGKLLATAYVILVTTLLNNHMKYVSFITAIITLLGGGLWIYYNIKLHKAYIHSVKKMTYLHDYS